MPSEESPNSLNPEELIAREKLLQELEMEEQYRIYLESDILGRIQWDPKQWQFITETDNARGYRLKCKEIMIAGLNQGGKSTSLCAKASYHATGRYPKNWRGRKWTHPINFAIGGETASSTRDLLCDRLLGPPDKRGSGFIPSECFEPEEDITRMSGGVANQVESFRVKHFTDGKFDGYSKGYVFSYSSGWQRLAGYTLHEVFGDEEMDFLIYDEFSARLNFTEGFMSISMTPLLGETDLYVLFERGGRGGLRHLINFGVNDAAHMSQAHRQQLIAKYEGHPLAEARLHGMPVRGKGLVYAVPDDMVVCEDFIIPSHWPRLIGIDLPHTTGCFAAILCALNPATDELFVIAEYKADGQASEIYASRVRAMGGDQIPVAWPHDGAREYTSGSTVAERYRQMGLNMLPEHAHIIDPQGRKVHAIFEAVERALDRMLTGRFQVFRSCTEFLSEKRKYRHDKGKIVKRQDDHLIDAMHKVILALHHASAGGERTSVHEWRLKAGSYDFFG